MITSDRKKFEFQVDVDLSEAEHKQKMLEHVAIEREIDDVRARKAVAMNEFTKELRGKNKVRETLLTIIDSKKEKRLIDCYLEPDHRRGMMRTLRCDNDEVVDERALTMDERDAAKQPTLPFIEDASVPSEATTPIDENEESEDTEGDDSLDATLERFEEKHRESDDPVDLDEDEDE